MRTVRRFVRMAGRLATVAACVAMVACKGLGDITAPTPVETPVAAVELNVEQLTVAEGTTAILQVTARDANAAVIANLQTFWSSSDTTVAKVSASGVVSALKSGTATIAASVGGRSATARITVAARAVASVQISPPTPSLLVGGFVQLTARTFDDAGGTLAGRTIFWSSNAPTTAVVDVNGLVTGIAPGVATITATSEARSAAVGVTVAQVPAASVQVSPPRDTIVLGQTTQLAAAVRDSVGALLTGRVVSWNSASAALATVSSTGLVLGVAPGTVTISATAEGRTGTAVIVVLSRPVGAVIVSPTTSSLVVGQTVQLNTQITDGSGNLLTGRPVSFASSNANVAQVSASGVVTATAPGAATITVTSEGKTGSASITVSASPVASIRITPTTASLVVGGTTKLAADALDAAGAVLPQRTITWTSGAPAVATVSADGTVTAVGAGTVLIFASAEGRIASATITATASSVATVSVTPSAPTLIAGQSVDLTATVRDPNGVAIGGKSITWSSGNPAVAIVSSTGRVRGVSPGTASITATTDGLAASAQVTVVAVPVGSVSMVLASPTLLVRFTTQATATVRDSAGNVLVGRAVTWTSSAPGVATINASGLITGVALGVTTIRATIDGKEASAPLSVITGQPTALASVSPTTLSAAAGTAVSSAPSVRVTDSGGSAVPGVVVVFAVTGGNGSTTPASPASVVSNLSGIATIGAWTLGAVAGTNTLTATVQGLTGSPVTFTAQGTIGAPASMTPTSVTTQSAVAGTAVAAPPRVRVNDAFGNPVAGVAVTFDVVSGAGSIAPASPAVVLTDASGIAQLTSWTLGGPAGANSVTATVANITGSPVTFTATGTVGTPSMITAVSTTAQSATAGSAVSAPPSVKISDSNGNGVVGQVVTFAVASGGGTLVPASPAAVTTDANGVATLTSWTLGAASGTNSVTATASGLTGSPVTFTASGVSGTARTMAAVSVTTQTAVSGTAVAAPPSVRITDVNGNPVSGVAVGFSVTTGGGSIVPASPASVNTNASGVATLTSWTLGTVVGANSVTAAVGGLTGSPQVFSATGTVGTATKLGLVTQPAGAVSGSPFTTQPVVQVRDVNNNVVASSVASVTVALASGSGTLSGTTTVTAVNGVATFTNLQIVGTGAHTLTFTSTGLTAVTSNSLTVNPGAATQVAITTQPAGAVSGLALVTQPVVQIRDANGNLTTSGAAITVAIASGTGALSGTTTVNAVNGVATFSNLSIAGSGAHTLTFTGTGLTAATSASVTVTQAAASLSIQAQPTTAASGANLSPQPVVRILDNAGLVVTSGTGATLAVSAVIASGTGTLGGTATATAVNGVATFTNLAISGLGAHTLRFATTTPALAVTSASITVAAGAAATIAANSVTTQSAAAGTAVAAPPSVKVTDATGNAVSGVAVTFTVTAGGGSIAPVSPASVSTNALGIATLTSWTLGAAAGANTVTAAVSSLAGSPVSFSATGTVGAATQLAITTQPSGAVSGLNLSTQPVVSIRDAGGNTVPGNSASVTAALASGTGALVGTTTVVAVNGVATFTNLRINGSGAHTLTFTSTGLTAATSPAFTVTQVAASLSVLTQPAGAVSNTAFTTQPVVRVLDNAGLVVSTGSGASLVVTAAKASGSGTLGGTLTATAVNGVATFTDLTIVGSGAHTLAFSTAAPALSVTSTTLTVVAGAATQLAVSTQPAGAVSGVAFTTQPVVQLRDADGNLTTITGAVTAAVASGTGTLSGTTTVNAVNGVATFTNLAITGSGAHTLTFTSGALTSATSASFTVGAPSATQLAITTQPAGAVSGVNLTTQPVVELRDANNALVSSGASVTVAVASGSGTLVGTTTVAAVNGVATFTNLRLNGSGAHTLTFTSTGLTAATSASITVTQVAASLSLQTQPAGAVSNTAFTTQPVVRVLDNAGLVVSTGSGASLVVTAAKASGTGTLGGTLTATAVNGVASFTSLEIVGSGNHTLSFSTTSPTLSISSATLTVAAGPATQLAVSTQPAGAASGTAFTTQPVVQLRDADGNVSTSTAAVTAAIASGTGTLGGTVTVNAVNGVATFTNLAITGSGAHTLTFSSGSLTSATSASFTVATAAATQVVLTTQPAGAVSGVNLTTQPVVELRDATNAIVLSNASVTAAIASGSGTLVGTTTVAAVNGVATFTNLRINGSGAHTLTFTSTGLTAATSSSLTVSQVAASLSMQTQPAGAVSSAPFTTQPVVRVLDNAGLVVSTGSGASLVVTATKASGSGTIGGTLTATAVNGVATFTDLEIVGSGAHTLSFSTASPALTITSASLTVLAGPATQLAFGTQPAGAVSGVAFSTQPVIQLRDADGNVSTSTAAVTATVASGTGTLSGTTTVNAVNGLATFTNLAITGSGAHTLSFASGVLTSVTSASFTVNTPSATQLAVATQPAGAVSGVPLTTQPVVEIRDASNAVVTSSSAAVTATITTGSGALVGTATVNAVNGVATFTTLRIDGSGAHVLTFSSPTLTSAASTSFTVTQVAAALSVQTQPAGAASGAAFTTQPVVRILDNAGLLVTTGAGASLVVTAAKATGTGTLGGTLTATASGGIATFSSLAITGTGAHSLQFTTASPALSVSSSSFTVAAGAATQLAVTTQPAGAVSGINLTTQPIVTVRDAGGNTASTSSASVTATITSGTGALVGTATVNAVNGVATFTNLRVNGSGAHTLTFSSAGLTSAASASFTVTQAAAALVLTTPPSGGTSGSALTTQPVVEIRDNAGLKVVSGADATLSVAAAVQTGTGTLGGTTAVAAVAGVATFTNLAITGSGAHTLQFTTATPALSVNSASITIAGAASQLALTTQPGGAVSGVNLATQPVVEIRDAGGTLVSTSSAAVTAALTSGNGVLLGTATVNAVNGVATFSTLRVNGSGAQTLTFTSGALTSAVSTSFTVTQVAASLSVQTQPSGATSGVAFTTQPVVRILDNAGLLVTTGTGATLSVSAAKLAGSGTLGGTTAVAAVGGVATFTSLAITGSGSHQLQFTTAAPALSVNSTAFTVIGPATQLALTTQPAGAVSGVPFTTQPVVEVRDASGNRVTGSTVAVTVAIASGTGALVGTTTVNAVNGVATFTNLELDGSGAHTLTFTSGALTAATSNSITVTQVAASLVVTTEAVGGTTGAALTTQPVIEVRDNAGLKVVSGAGATLTVTAAIQSGTGTLGGTVAIAAVGGVATFTNLAITGTGSFTLRFTTATPALTIDGAPLTVNAFDGP